MRVSSVIPPRSSCGTLRSERMKTRLPSTSTSARRISIGTLARFRPGARRAQGAVVAHDVEFFERSAGRRYEQEGKQRVDGRRQSAQRHPRAERQGKAQVLAVGLADAGRMCRERVGHGRMPYRAAISTIVVSSIRFENPHSLSYQEDTFTRRPDTLVSVASKIDERGS